MHSQHHANTPFRSDSTTFLRSDHAECAAAAIALVAMGDAGSSSASSRALSANGQSSSFSAAEADREGPKLPAAEWPGRMLTGGGWQSLIRCLSVLPESTAMHQVVPIGLKYLSLEVGALYTITFLAL